MNILITEKEFQEYKTLQQENIRLNKVLKQLVDEETDWQVNNGQVKLEKLQQEKEDLIKWLEEEKEYKLREYCKELNLASVSEDIEQTKTFQKILQVQQNEIDQLERNCDVFYEQMNDAVERTVELNKEKKDLKEWLEEEIEEANQLASVGDNYMRNAHELRILAFQEVLERLG